MTPEELRARLDEKYVGVCLEAAERDALADVVEAARLVLSPGTMLNSNARKFLAEALARLEEA